MGARPAGWRSPATPNGRQQPQCFRCTSRHRPRLPPTLPFFHSRRNRLGLYHLLQPDSEQFPGRSRRSLPLLIRSRSPGSSALHKSRNLPRFIDTPTSSSLHFWSNASFLPTRFPGSSMVEHSAVNRRVASSNLARGANFSFFLNYLQTAIFSSSSFCGKLSRKCNGARFPYSRLLVFPTAFLTCSAIPNW